MNFDSMLWGVPFFGIILSMSFLPLISPKFWEKYSGYVPLGWTLLYLTAIGFSFGIAEVGKAFAKPLIDDYVSFIVQIATLYIVAGGIYIDFPSGKGPAFNTIFLFFGAILAGWIGTTGASMLLIRPFLRVNTKRQHKVHLMIFFILLVANIGGAATPLGDPPLFIGFLKGIDFFWFIRHLYPILFGTIVTLCAMFYAIDTYLFKKETGHFDISQDDASFSIKGIKNLLLLMLILLVVILCQFPERFSLFGDEYLYSSLIRNCLLIGIAACSIKITHKNIREANGFTLAPIREVAEFFIAMFVTVSPLLVILAQGKDGAFAPIFEWIAPNGTYSLIKCFWASGLLSSFLDNAPTFLVFFHLTSGNAQELMTVKSAILSTFSISTVFMGALTYIGNAPNLMIRSISESYGIKVPSFLGYIKWSAGILIPIFIIISVVL